MQAVLAFSSSGSTDQSHYNINETVNFTFTADQNLTSNTISNITIYLLNSSEHVFNYTTIYPPNATNFTTQLNTTVNTSGNYIVKANFTFNNTYFESSAIVKISKAHSIVIATNKPAYSPGETINFTVRATDVNNIGVSDENVTVRLMYSTNDTVLASKLGLTNSAGEYTSTFTAPSTIGSYRLTVNDWVTTKIVDISTFDLVAFTGDINGDIKTKFAAGDTAYIYMDLFDTNKTRYTGTETISVQVTPPNGTQNNSVPYTFSGSRVNTSFVVSDNGIYSVKVTVVSTSKSVKLPIEVGMYEIIGWLERNTTATTFFFPHGLVDVKVKVFNVSSGEAIKTTGLAYPFELTLLDSSFANASTISNATTVSADGVRKFSFNAPNTTGLYYVKVRLNQSLIILDMKVTDSFATATPVDQSNNFKNVFVGTRQTIRILTTLANATHSVNITNVSAVSVKTSKGVDITSSLGFNTSIVDYKNGKAGLVEFSSPGDAGLYFIKTLANNNFAAETQLLVKFYTACAQLDGYKWFISSNENANLTIRVSEAKDVGLIDSLSGNSSDTTNTEGNGTGSFSGMYGMHDCYGDYKTVASGSSTAGNNTANIVVKITKVINTLNGEDVTTKVGNLPSSNTNDNGRVALNLTKPSGGWDGGTYVVELELRDKNNNTDKGFGTFQVKNLWINVWPQQISGRWKWYFSPNEQMNFSVNAYNSSGTWYYYGQNNGIGDNCTVLGLFYQGNGAEWFWPPKTVPTNKYTYTCRNTTAPANGRFNLNITQSSAFDTGYYMVRVKVNTTSGVGDSGEGWFALKAYNVYVRTTSANYYDSWYRGVTDNVTLDIDVTFANSTRWECYWQKCPSNELVKENLNISAKLIKYDEWNPGDYSTSKYNALFANRTDSSTTTNTLIAFFNYSTFSNVSVNSTRNTTYITTNFNSGNTTSNVTLSAAGSNASVTASIPKNATINSAFIQVSPFANNLLVNVSLNDTSAFLNYTNVSASSSVNTSFASNLNSFLSACTAVNNNCTVGFNVTLNASGTVKLDGLRINYNQVLHHASSYNSSTSISIPKNATINSAFIGINSTRNATGGNVFLVNTTLSNDTFNLANLFNTNDLNTSLNNVSFGSALTSALSTCTAVNNNCTLGFNVTVGDTPDNTLVVTLSNLRISYNTTQTVQNTSSRYINTTSGNANLTLIPTGGKDGRSWETGYYSAAVTVDGPQGKETGNYWFEIRSFFVNMQTVKMNDTRQTTYTYTSGDTIRINVSATNKPSWLSNYYSVSLTNVPTNITKMRLSYWDYNTYTMTEIPVTWTPNTTINGTTTVNITSTAALSAGKWYNLEATLTDASGNNQTGWASFEIKDFTFSTRTGNWRWAFNNTENISLDVAVCTGDTWWCNFGANSYTGSNVNVSVTKLQKSDTWPYTAVSGWTANSTILNSSNNGQGIIVIDPTSTLSGGYYTAELLARYADGSGSPVTTNVWFRIESFTLSASPTKWSYKMSENVTLKITSSAATTLSDATISCGYWPDQTYYSVSGGTLSANSTSLNAGQNIIMLSPSGRNWVSGYCYGSIYVTSGGETQTAWVSFDMKAFSLSTTQTKYTYLKNESITMTILSDSNQYFNISGINITFYNYENNTNIEFTLGQHFTSNATGKAFKGSAIINITPNGNWTLKGWYNGKLVAADSNTTGVSQTTWFYFDIRDVLHAYGWPVRSGTTDYFSYNTSSENISLVVYTYKYNVGRTDWWPYDSKSGINITITSIEKQSCSSWPCTYSAVTGWSAPNGTSKSNGQAQLNITRSGGWGSGWHYANVQLLDTSTNETSTLNKQIGFWVNA